METFPNLKSWPTKTGAQYTQYSVMIKVIKKHEFPVISRENQHDHLVRSFLFAFRALPAPPSGASASEAGGGNLKFALSTGEQLQQSGQHISRRFQHLDTRDVACSLDDWFLIMGYIHIYIIYIYI